MLDDGILTDSHGLHVNFENCIIIMTSNAGANRIISPKNLGFGAKSTAEEEYQRMKDGVMEEVRHIFKPEFINRVDELIVFHVLSEENIHDITAILSRALEKRLKEQTDLTLRLPDEVIDFVAKKGFDRDYGARPIRRELQSQVEDTLAEAMLSGRIHRGDTVGARVAEEPEKHVEIFRIEDDKIKEEEMES